LEHRYFIQLSFHGKNYHGWQRQPNAITVQQVLEEKLSLQVGHPIEIIGAGRTDSGVHASYYVAHFNCEKNLQDDVDFLHKLNRFLPLDIAVQKISRVNADAHSRFHAVSRTYNYFIHRLKNPFLDETSFYLYGNLNVAKMNQAADLLLSFTDFTSFSKLHTDTKTNNCKIYSAQWIEQDEKLVFTIKADRFLRNMVRSITGTLLEIGREKLSMDDFVKIIESKNRSNAGDSMPAKALFLVDIEYPEWVYQMES